MSQTQIDAIRQSLSVLMDIASQQIDDLDDETMMALTQLLNQANEKITTLKQNIEQKPVEAANLGKPPSPDAQLLWILSGQQEQAFISYLREYPSEATQALLNNPSELSRTINYLNRMMPHGEQPVIDGIQHADLNSSNIWGTAYNPSSGKMKVRFQGGSEYEYDGVPANIYNAFSKGNASAKTTGSNQYGAWFVGKNPSLGAAMNQYIKAGGFPYRKLN